MDIKDLEKTKEEIAASWKWRIPKAGLKFQDIAKQHNLSSPRLSMIMSGARTLDDERFESIEHMINSSA